MSKASQLDNSNSTITNRLHNEHHHGLEYLPVANLLPYSGNARTHSKKQVRQIADSMKRFGFTNPILIDDEGMILAGHGRAQAALLLGLDVVPCLRLSRMSEAEKRAYILADNKLAQNAGWDEDLLARELSFLLGKADEIEIDVTGFTIAEIDMVLEPGGTSPQVDTEREDNLPEIVNCGEPVSCTGDIWLLGDHRLICGDARNADVYQRLMVKKATTEDLTNSVVDLADMVFTDPPYNVPIDGNVCGSGSIRHREFAHASGEMNAEQFTTFLRESLSLLADNARDGSIHFICMDWRHMRELLDAGEAVYSELKNLIVWAKDNGGMGTFYRSRHELIFAFKKGTATHINTFELGQHGRYRTNVWNYRGITSATKQAREELAMHPTVKPVAMLADALKDCCPRGGIVLDAFAGSGSILIAAQKTGRRARAIEIDPVYCDVAIRRWETYAKDEAILLSSGQSFAEVQKTRAAEHRLKGGIPEAGKTTGNEQSSAPAEVTRDVLKVPSGSQTTSASNGKVNQGSPHPAMDKALPWVRSPALDAARSQNGEAIKNVAPASSKAEDQKSSAVDGEAAA